MDKKPPQPPEMKTVISHLKDKKSPRKTQEDRAAETTAHIIKRLQHQSRPKK